MHMLVLRSHMKTFFLHAGCMIAFHMWTGSMEIT